MDLNLRSKLEELLKTEGLDQAIVVAENELKALPVTRFHAIIGKNLLSLTPGLIDYVDTFYMDSTSFFEGKGKSLKAIYSEMNGFSINYDRWFIDIFSYSFIGEEGDHYWLADYEFEAQGSYIISGFEDVQGAFEDYMKNKRWSDKTQEACMEICEYIVILRLQQLFKNACEVAKSSGKNWAGIPVFVTAHDYDFIYDCN